MLCKRPISRDNSHGTQPRGGRAGGGRVVLAALLVCGASFEASASISVLGVQYQQDELFPEYNCIWHDKDYPTSCSGTYLGGNLHVYIKNTGASSVSLDDMTLAGYSLNTVVKLDPSGNQHEARSVYYYFDNPQSEAPALYAAGLPVWYKLDPATIPAGGVGQAIIRLRFPPTTPTVTVGVTTTGGAATTNITIEAAAPQLANVGFSTNRVKVYLHWRRGGGAAPVSVLMDGVDVTANTVTVGDPSVNYAESVLTPATPLTYMSYHVFQGVYADGKKATAALRAWSHPFLHATWDVFPGAGDDTAHTQAWIDEATSHGFNAAQNQVSGIAGYLDTAGGRAYADARGGYGIIQWNNYTTANPLLNFIHDEIDAEEDNLGDNFCGTGKKLDCGASPMGILGMRSIGEGESYRAQFPNTPTTINMDGTFKPENYYSYGQAVDVLQADPYYQKRLKDTYWYHYPEWVPLYNKATYIYAVSKACTRAAEPNSFHVILNSTESKEDVNGTVKIWPFATPQCKRIEVYYALAAGAKGISYWWFKPCSGQCSNGLGDQSKQTARDLWREMGIYGNEIKTVSPLLVTSHPIDMALSPSANVWARALAAGPDTIILLVVNDNYYNDDISPGFHSTDVNNATVTATLPSWLQTSLSAFEVTAGGLSDVTMVRNGSQLQVSLGTLKITRMIVVTKDASLRPAIQQRYVELVRPGVCAFAPEYCANLPPSISQQPANQAVTSGGTANFTLVVAGTSPLNYQWQKNSVNLSNGGHVAGCATATLTISTADSGDAGSYRCVVTNAYGSVTSSVAVLTIGGSCSSPVLVNGSFEGTTNAGVGDGWVGYQRGSPPPTTTWSIQVANPPAGGGAHYQQIANTSSTTSGGGVRQDITGCIVGATYQIAGWMRGNSQLYATCRVKCSPTASTDWATAMDLSPPQTYTGTNWTAFSGTVVATGTNMTLWLDGQTGSTGANKAECFDMVTVTCLSAPATPPALTQQPSPATNCENTTATFSVAANGSGLVFQWQRNGSDLGDDGHYLGCTTPALTITNADSSDAANYRCRVSNDSGWTNSNEAPLTVRPATAMVEQPSDANVDFGGTTNLSVIASGDGALFYQWQKNQANLVDGGHYSGCTTPTLMISGADFNDVGNYGCVVTAGCGASASAQATLTVGCSPVAALLLNADFEGPADVPGIGTNWVGYQRAPNPTTVWTLQSASPPEGGGLQYQQIANTSADGGGGVRQDVSGCAIGATYLVSGWMRGNSLSNSTCTVKCSPSASTNWATAIDLEPPQTYTGTNWTFFSGRVVATGTNMTIWLDGQTGGSGLTKAECFDSVSVSCMAGALPFYFASVALLPQNQVRLVLNGPPGGSVTIQRSSDLAGWLPLTNLINTNGTLTFTDAPPANTTQRFYRATSP